MCRQAGGQAGRQAGGRAGGRAGRQDASGGECDRLRAKNREPLRNWIRIDELADGEGAPEQARRSRALPGSVETGDDDDEWRQGSHRVAGTLLPKSMASCERVSSRFRLPCLTPRLPGGGDLGRPRSGRPRRHPGGPIRSAAMAVDRFEVFVGKEYLKFNAAHFIAYPGFRERVHGHNYQVTVRIGGDLGPDGYVVDFGLVKRVTRELCDGLDERLLLPEKSDCLVIRHNGKQIEVTYEDGAWFSFPKDDVLLLPIVHSSAEELAQYVAGELALRLRQAGARPWRRFEVSVAEAAGQSATFVETGDDA